MDLGRKVLRDRTRKIGCGHTMPSLECQFKESAIHLEGNWETSKDFEKGWGIARTGSILGD